MAGNADAAVARRFHDTTAHSPHSVRTSGHTLDWDIKPFPFKVYTDVPAVELPRVFDPVATDTIAALAEPGDATAALPLDRLAALLYLTAGVTRKKTYPGGGEVLFRAAASTGALYQTEVYVAAGDVRGLTAGLYHFCPGDFTLRRLREGDVRGALARAATDEDLARRPAVIVLSAIYWRNTWKYQARGFRHLFWDSGTMLANLLAVGGALGLGPSVATGFVDDEVNRLLGLDPAREAVLELVAVGARDPGDIRDPDGGHAKASDVPAPIAHETLPLSSDEVDYPALREMMSASRLLDANAVREWRRGSAPPPRAARGALIPLPSPHHAAGRALGDTIQRRGSTRAFAHAPITGVALATVLWAATRPVPADVPSALVDVFLIVNAIDGVAPGAYAYRREAHALERVREGAFRDRASYLTLEQALGGDAAATLFFLAPLDDLLARFGNRGYRLANLEAGIAGGRAYLAAYAQGFGASGLTFYDRLVVEFFAPASAGLDAIFVTALGHSVREPRSPVIDRLSRPG
jgi:SagB-type dehydrogenase family enzyme